MSLKIGDDEPRLDEPEQSESSYRNSSPTSADSEPVTLDYNIASTDSSIPPWLQEDVQRLVDSDSSLTILNLYAKKIGDAGAKALASALSVNVTLLELYLGDNHIGPAGAVALARALCLNQTIEVFVLGVNNIGDVGARAFETCLRSNTVLYWLDLSWNNIGDEGAKAIASGLEHNRSIETLHLMLNQIDVEGAEALLKVSQTHSVLKELFLQGNPFCQNKMEEQETPRQASASLSTS